MTAPAERTGILIGWYDDGGRFRRRVEAEVRLEPAKDGERLAVTFTSGEARNDGGFILDRDGEPRAYSGGAGTDEFEAVTEFAAGWDAARRDRLVEVAKRWHLNDMRPGCEHQRAAGWSERPIDRSKPTDSYGLHFEGQRSASWNMLGWVRPEEHPSGLLGKPCPECGYRYGTAWLHEPLPDDVRAFALELIGGGADV